MYYIFASAYNTNVNITVARKAVADVNLDEMIAESMKDTVSDEEPEGDDDPALLVCDI